MIRNLVILLTSLALGGVAAAAPAAPPQQDDDDDTQAEPADPYQPTQPAPGPQAQPSQQPQRPMPPMPPTMPRGQQARLGIAVGSDRGTAMVNEVIPGSAAERAGLQPGDQIVSVAGSPTTSADQVVAAIAARRPGDPVAISVLRNGQRVEIRATLEGDRGTAMPRPPRWNRSQPAPGFRDYRTSPGMRGGPFGGELELRRQLDEANRRIDELERRLQQLERKGG